MFHLWPFEYILALKIRIHAILCNIHFFICFFLYNGYLVDHKAATTHHHSQIYTCTYMHTQTCTKVIVRDPILIWSQYTFLHINYVGSNLTTALTCTHVYMLSDERVKERQMCDSVTGREGEEEKKTWPHMAHNLLPFWPQVPHRGTGQGLTCYGQRGLAPRPDRWQIARYSYHRRVKWLQIDQFDRVGDARRAVDSLQSRDRRTVHSPVRIFYLLVMTFIFHKQMKT